MENIFARRTGASSADGLTAILHLATATDLISFAGGFPDPSTFPGSVLAEIFQRFVSDGDVSAMQYGPVAGLPGPRSFMINRLEEREGHRPNDDEMMITSGNIEALELLGKALLDPRDLVLVEGPTYLGAIMAFQSFEANVVSVGMDDHGLDINRLEETLEQHGKPKFIYTIPDHSNPAGVSLEENRRRQFVEVARRDGFLIVEDVAYRELGFSEDRPPSLYGIAPDVVVQANTFSKTFFPGVRLGWAAGPNDVIEKMIWAKQNTDQCAGALGQRLLEEYGRAGGLEEQAARARALYSRRCKLLLDALEAHMPDDVAWTTPQGGFFSWLRLPTGADGIAVAKGAVEDGVAVVPGAPFYPGDGGARNIRLSFSRVEDASIDEGIKRLAAVVVTHTERTS